MRTAWPVGTHCHRSIVKQWEWEGVRDGVKESGEWEGVRDRVEWEWGGGRV